MSHRPDPRITIELLAAKFPRTFFVNGGERKPLKIGITNDLIAAELKFSGTNIRLALRAYASSPGYLSAMQEGAVRVGLDGEPAGIVTEDAAMHAGRKRAALEARVAPRQEIRQSNAIPSEIASCASSPAPADAPAGPKKLGLADLKQAWQRRQAKQGAA
jgi:ProP effector